MLELLEKSLEESLMASQNEMLVGFPGGIPKSPLKPIPQVR